METVKLSPWNLAFQPQKLAPCCKKIHNRPPNNVGDSLEPYLEDLSKDLGVFWRPMGPIFFVWKSTMLSRGPCYTVLSSDIATGLREDFWGRASRGAAVTCSTPYNRPQMPLALKPGSHSHSTINFAFLGYTRLFFEQFSANSTQLELPVFEGFFWNFAWVFSGFSLSFEFFWAWVFFEMSKKKPEIT